VQQAGCGCHADVELGFHAFAGQPGHGPGGAQGVVVQAWAGLAGQRQLEGHRFGQGDFFDDVQQALPLTFAGGHAGIKGFGFQHASDAIAQRAPIHLAFCGNRFFNRTAKVVRGEALVQARVNGRALFQDFDALVVEDGLLGDHWPYFAKLNDRSCQM